MADIAFGLLDIRQEAVSQVSIGVTQHDHIVSCLRGRRGERDVGLAVGFNHEAGIRIMNQARQLAALYIKH